MPLITLFPACSFLTALLKFCVTSRSLFVRALLSKRIYPSLVSVTIYSILRFSHKLLHGVRRWERVLILPRALLNVLWEFRSYADRMLSCKKDFPDQSNTLPSPNNVPLRYGRCQALQDRSDEEPILEELEEWSLIPNRPWVPRSPSEIDANSPRLPIMLWSSPIKAFITRTEWRLPLGRRGPREVTARW